MHLCSGPPDPEGVRTSEAGNGEQSKVPNKNILVLGGTVFIGKTIVECLVKAGFSLTLVNRGRSYWEGEKLSSEVTYVKSDRRRASSFAQTLQQLTKKKKRELEQTRKKKDSRGNSDICCCCWLAVIDCCAYDVKDIEAALEGLGGEFGVYVYISTDSVYEVCDSAVWKACEEVDEDMARRPTDRRRAHLLNRKDSYGHKKLRVEEILRQYAELHGRHVVALRLADVIGPYDDSYRLWAYLLWCGVCSKHPLVVDADATTQPINLTFAPDVAAAVLALLDSSSSSNRSNSSSPNSSSSNSKGDSSSSSSTSGNSNRSSSSSSKEDSRGLMRRSCAVSQKMNISYEATVAASSRATSSSLSPERGSPAAAAVDGGREQERETAATTAATAAAATAAAATAAVAATATAVTAAAATAEAIEREAEVLTKAATAAAGAGASVLTTAAAEATDTAAAAAAVQNEEVSAAADIQRRSGGEKERKGATAYHDRAAGTAAAAEDKQQQVTAETYTRGARTAAEAEKEEKEIRVQATAALPGEGEFFKAYNLACKETATLVEVLEKVKKCLERERARGSMEDGASERARRGRRRNMKMREESSRDREEDFCSSPLQWKEEKRCLTYLPSVTRRVPLSLRRIETDLHFSPTFLDDAIQQTCQWLLAARKRFPREAAAAARKLPRDVRREIWIQEAFAEENFSSSSSSSSLSENEGDASTRE